MSIRKTLKELGLNQKEIKVYIALLKAKKMKASDIARVTKISRPTVYSTLKGLQSEGLVIEDIGGSAISFVAVPPEEGLQKVVKAQEREFTQTKELAEKAISELSMITADEYPVPKIQFVEERELEKFLYDNTLKWQDAAIKSDGVVWGMQDAHFATTFQTWIDFMWTTQLSKHKHYKACHITDPSSFEKRAKGKYPKDKRDMRFINGLDLTATTWVSGDFFVTAVTQKRPFYLIEIHDEIIAHNMREAIKQLWKQADKLP